MRIEDDFATKAEAAEAAEDIPSNPHLENSIGDVIYRRYGRRDVLKGTLAVTASTALFGRQALTSARAQDAAASSFNFTETQAGVDETHHVASGYDADILLRWGDPLFEDSPKFDPASLTAEAQLRQFGYNNDYVGFFPIDGASDRALLCVNHEYTNTELMFPGITARPDKNDFEEITRDRAEVEMAAHGITVVEIILKDGRWVPNRSSRYNRRITPLNTEMSVDGPAAGHRRMVTRADPSGRRITGTINNCAGGITPWGTYLTAEENFHGYFWTDKKDEDGKRLRKGLGGDQNASYERYGIPANWYNWGTYHDRFNVEKEPNEPNRFGWIVEIDPFDPASTPVKHTALGRFKHEGAECIVNSDGRVVVYCGDDQRSDYLYRYVSSGKVDPDDKAANMRLLSEGTLFVARFNVDGSVDWLPLLFGVGPLTPDNGFESQADVVIDARLAADLLGATPMDRPEDVQPNEKTGKVYVMLTNNKKRQLTGSAKEPRHRVNVANPRAVNLFGHIIELTPPNGDHGADKMVWEIMIRCGDPAVEAVGALWNEKTSADGWFAAPDNCAIDADGRLWVATDQGKGWKHTGKADGLYGVETEGALRATSKLFFRVPVGAEMCGPCFTPDAETLFLAVQHPASDGVKDYEPFGKERSTFEDPATRWPDFKDNMPPRPSVIAIRKQGGGKIAG